MRDVTDLYESYGEDRLPPLNETSIGFRCFRGGAAPFVPVDVTVDVGGMVESELSRSFSEFETHGKETQRQDFPFVTGCSRFDCVFSGVPFSTLAEHVGLEANAAHVIFHIHDGYSTDLPLSECLHEAVLFAWEFAGEPLSGAHGGSRRVVTPHRYAYTGAKWGSGVAVLTEAEWGYRDPRGF